MKIRRSTTRVIAVLTLFALIAAACGGGDTEPEPIADAAPTVAGAIPTTAPVTAPVIEADEEVVDATELGFTEEDLDVSPWEVAVLHVNDDVQIVPAFDAPNGNEKTIYDVNTVSDPTIELEYPLYATTVFGNKLALLVEEYDSTGNWAKVQVPVRPNGTTAWVQTAFFTEEKHDYHITIDVSENKVNVYKGDELLVEQIAVTGRDSRPTPVVRAYIDEKIRGETLSPAYGDWVLSIAAFSETLPTFGGGGMPKLALHGTNQPELMGQYVSSGCIRVPNEIISMIADAVPVGTIVDIIA